MLWKCSYSVASHQKRDKKTCVVPLLSILSNLIRKLNKMNDMICKFTTHRFMDIDKYVMKNTNKYIKL